MSSTRSGAAATERAAVGAIGGTISEELSKRGRGYNAEVLVQRTFLTLRATSAPQPQRSLSCPPLECRVACQAPSEEKAAVGSPMRWADFDCGSTEASACDSWHSASSSDRLGDETPTTPSSSVASPPTTPPSSVTHSKRSQRTPRQKVEHVAKVDRFFVKDAPGMTLANTQQAWRSPHARGQCKPCIFFAYGVCADGDACMHCHLEHDEGAVNWKRTRPPKHVRLILKERTAMLGDGAAQPAR